MSSAAVNRNIGMGEWGTSAQFTSEYEDFVSRITNVLVECGVGSRTEIEKVVREVSQQFFAYALHKPHRPIAYWHRFLYLLARNTPRWIKVLLKRNMTKTLGTVLDYKGVSFNEAIAQLHEAGVSFDKNEMLEMHKFLIKFHESFR